MGIRNIYFTSGSGSFKLPVDFDPTQPVTVLCLGSGGGGARRFAASGGGAGGGGGSLARGTFSGLKPADLIYYSVGIGGAGGASNGANGTSGQSTWVNIVSNAVPSNSSQGVLAVGGGGGTGATSGAGGLASSSIGGLGTASGGNGGTGPSGNGSGGAGGGSSGNWNGASSYTTGNNGGDGGSVSGGDRGGGGGGGVNGAGSTTFSITGGTGGLNYNNTSAGAGTSAVAGGGGGGGSGTNSNNVVSGGGGWGGSTSVNELTGVVASGWSSGGGGGGGGTNNSGTTGGTGGRGGIGAGGGGGGSGVTNGGTGGDGGNGLVLITYTARTTMLPSTGALSFDDVQTYYGGVNPISMNEYYSGGTFVPTLARNASDVAVPSTGQISMSSFRGSPFKLYREMRSGYQLNSSKFTFFQYYGYDTTTGVGGINNTAFTLSGGAGVAISSLYWSFDDNFGAPTTALVFALTSTSQVSNSGWESMILNNGTVFSRASATFAATATTAQWVWSGATYPFLTGGDIYTQYAGQINMIYFV